jgi:hypothetical protein
MIFVLLAACGGTVAPSDAEAPRPVDASASDASVVDVAAEGSPGEEQPLCALCDPSLLHPCLAGKDICKTYLCDPATRRCIVRAFDAGLCGPQTLPTCP